MKTTASLSIVMTTVNGGRYVAEQLGSLARQTRLPDELLVCDDGSTDDTIAIVTLFARTAPFPVRLVRNRVRLGYADNFLHGARLARSELIAFCDQDDVWHPAKLRRCVDELARTRALLVIHNAEVVDAQLRPLGRAKPDFARTATLPPRGCELAITLPGFAMVFGADLIRGLDPAHRPADHMQAGHPLMAHDQWIVFLARSAGRVVQLAETLAQYRQHDANTCGAAPPVFTPGLNLERETNVTAYWRRAEASAHYSAALDALAPVAGTVRGARWRRSAAQYRDQAKRYAVRSWLHDAAHPRRQQARHFFWLLAHLAYRSHRASGLGWRALLKDAASLLRSNRATPPPGVGSAALRSS
jgi:glycosyltransferase involved in cell wall biosynthesis